MTPVEQMRDPDATLTSLQAAIVELSPDNAQWWVFNVSHLRFMLRLYNVSDSEYLMIASFGAELISGPTHWEAPSLEFSISRHAHSRVEWQVSDAHAGFSFSCTTLYWGRNVGWHDQSGWFSALADPAVE